MVYKRIYNLPTRSFFLLGVRGVGKSSWARAVLQDALRFDLLDETLQTDKLSPG